MLGISKFSTNEGRCLIGAEESPFISANFIKSYQKTSWPRLMKEVYKKRKRSTFWPYAFLMHNPYCVRTSSVWAKWLPCQALWGKSISARFLKNATAFRPPAIKFFR